MISVCIIMKNEESCIGECLKRIVPFGWEIIVVDTGSEDKSKEIAAQYTDKIYDFKWINDFAAARNFAAEKADNDIIFSLDCDEFIEKCDTQRLYSLIKSSGDGIFCLSITDIYDRNGIEFRQVGRLGRIYSKSAYHYSGKIHEQVVRLDGKTPKYTDVPVYILHTGYNGTLEQRQQKAQRNIELLLLQLKENPDDPYMNYQLGKSYFMKQELEAAVKSFDRFISLSPDLKYEYVEDGIECLCYCLINLKEYKRALEVFKKYDGIYNGSADFEFLGGHVFMNNGMLSEAAMRFLKATERTKYSVEGTNSYSAFYNIGVIFECCAQKETAAEYFEKCGDYPPALEGLKRVRG